MGFKRLKLYKLTWETDDDDELNGLVVRAGTIPIGEYLELSDYVLRSKVPDRFQEEEVPEEAAFDWTIDLFTGSLASWNLEDADDQPIPATREGLMTQDRELVLRVIVQWVKALGSVTRPLKKPSHAGDQLVAASIPMETLPENLAS